MSNIEALAVDVDGTITDNHRKICISAIEALRKVEAAGIPVIIATGNIADFSYAVATMVGTTGGLVCENGGVIYKDGLNNNRVIVLADKEKVDKAYDLILEKFGDKIDFKLTEDEHGRFSEICFYKTFDPKPIKDALANLDIEVYDSGFAIHLTDANVSKGSSLQKLADLAEYNTENMMVIGDSENDLAAIEMAGLGIAVANAQDRVKEAADVIVASNLDDGCKEAIEKYLLKEY